MSIIRPISKAQVEISLFSDDGHMSYPGDFISSSGVESSLEDGKRNYKPITVSSPFDPVHYKDIINYCVSHLGSRRGPEDSFTLEFRVHRMLGREVWAQYQATGCRLIGYSLPEFDRESEEVARFSLVFQPSGVTNLLT